MFADEFQLPVPRPEGERQNHADDEPCGQNRKNGARGTNRRVADGMVRFPAARAKTEDAPEHEARPRTEPQRAEPSNEPDNGGMEAEQGGEVHAGKRLFALGGGWRRGRLGGGAFGKS